MYIPLSAEDILNAAILAVFLVIAIKFMSFLFFNLVVRTTAMPFQPSKLTKEELELFLARCYKLFPVDSLNWKGTILKRGATLRVVTKNSNLTGEFIGINNENMLCILTKNSVVAHELRTVLDIELI